MKQVITGYDDLVGPWIAERLGTGWVEGKGSTIGLYEAGHGICGATYYESCNGASILMHCAGEGRKWLNREFLWYAFYYPFEDLKVKKIISPVESTNENCRRFIENLGFSLEATLIDAAPKGDMLLYTMIREDCRWLNLREKYRGKAEGS